MREARTPACGSAGSGVKDLLSNQTETPQTPNPMNTALISPASEARCIPYAKAAGLLVPALLLWSFASVFLFPKLQLIWSLGGGPAADAPWLMDALELLMRHSSVGMGVMLLGLALIEWLVRPWALYRRPLVGLLVFLLNTAVLLGLTAMCLTALRIAPALMQAQ